MKPPRLITNCSCSSNNRTLVAVSPTSKSAARTIPYEQGSGNTRKRGRGSPPHVRAMHLTCHEFNPKIPITYPPVPLVPLVQENFKKMSLPPVFCRKNALATGFSLRKCPLVAKDARSPFNPPIRPTGSIRPIPSRPSRDPSQTSFANNPVSHLLCGTFMGGGNIQNHRGWKWCGIRMRLVEFCEAAAKSDGND